MEIARLEAVPPSDGVMEPGDGWTRCVGVFFGVTQGRPACAHGVYGGPVLGYVTCFLVAVTAVTSCGVPPSSTNVHATDASSLRGRNDRDVRKRLSDIVGEALVV